MGLPCQHQQGQSLVNSHRTFAELKPQTTHNNGPGSPLQPEVTQSNQSKSPNHPPLTTSTWEGITHLYAGQPQALVAGGPQAL